MKERIALTIISIIAFCECSPSSAEQTLGLPQLPPPQYTEGGNKETAKILHQMPPDFYPIQILNTPSELPDFYDSPIYLPMNDYRTPEQGCASTPHCTDYAPEMNAPMYGGGLRVPSVYSTKSEEAECHVETECYGLDKIPMNIDNATDILYLQYLNTSKLQKGSFSHLPPLIRLNIEYGDLAILEPGVFENQSTLQYVAIFGNSISELQPGTFQELKNLQDLEITDNKLSKLHRNIYKGLDSLTTLKLTQNKLAELRNDVFREMSQLKSLFLHTNNIAAISQHAFRGLNKLTALYLGSNFLSAVPSASFRDAPSLQVLHLDRNGISRVGRSDFNHLKSLHQIRLDQCNIDFVSRRAFRGKNLTFLDISENRLTRLGNLGYIGNHVSVAMAFNPWMCNCSLIPTTIWLNSYNVSVIPPYPDCVAPQHLKRNKLMHMTTKKLCDPAPINPIEDDGPDADKPEGNWADQVYDVGKLYPDVTSITNMTYTDTSELTTIDGNVSQPPMTRYNTQSDPYSTSSKATYTDEGHLTSSEYGKEEKRTTEKSQVTGTDDAITTTTVIHEGPTVDHMKTILLILGILIPVLLIIVFVLHSVLRQKRKATEKADIEMPHIESKPEDKYSGVNPESARDTEEPLLSNAPVHTAVEGNISKI